MKKTNFQNEEIKRTGDKILSAIRLSDVQIDEIVGSPQLFSRILETAARYEFSDRHPGAINQRPKFSGYHFRLSITCCAVLLISTVGFILLRDSKSNPTESEIIAETKFPAPIETPESADERQQVGSSTLETLQPLPASGIKPVERTSTARLNETRRHRNRMISTSEKAPVRLYAVKPEKPDGREKMDDFQFLAFDTDTVREGGRIVQVELPRASLYAMGVNIPPENGKPMIKTDLYLSSDGIMKAVRIARIN